MGHSGKDATGRNTTRRRASSGGRAESEDNPAPDDPHDAIDLELLMLWIGLSRLRDRLLVTRRLDKPRGPAIGKAPRHKAA